MATTASVLAVISNAIVDAGHGDARSTPTPTPTPLPTRGVAGSDDESDANDGGARLICAGTAVVVTHWSNAPVPANPLSSGEQGSEDPLTKKRALGCAEVSALWCSCTDPNGP